MTFQDMVQIIEPVLGHSLDREQLNVINHDRGPLWIVAGPGSGKTEVLVVRTLKLIFVNDINPKSVIITTFTEKAAKNLFDRILNYANYIFQNNPGLEQQIDLQSLRIGTLHGLCNDIMLEYRYPEYENYRLLDDVEQYLFIYEHSDLVKDTSNSYLPFWIDFDFLVDGYDPITNNSGWNDRSRSPNKWKKTNAAIKLFNRIVEDSIDLSRMRNGGTVWGLLCNAYDDYLQKLEDNRRCDFAHLQKKFLNFLNSQLGSLFLNGDSSDRHPGVKYVMVDEYQDTNPIQEAIYLKLAENTHNLCIVGDDDQALYRFRGGTVDCMVTFDQACNRCWSVPADQVRRSLSFLNANYRSHPNIVNYYDAYIRSFPAMGLNGARVTGKPSLDPRSRISGDHPAVAYITGRTIEITANNFAEFVSNLLANNIIQQPNQCVLLMRSVKETARNALHFANALRNRNILPYNPRSRTFLQQEEIMIVLGAFVSIVDPNLSALNTVMGTGIQQMVRGWIREYQRVTPTSPELVSYVNGSIREINTKPVDTWINVNILEIFYRILAHEPFATWENDPERSYRLGKLSKIFETYASIPYLNSPGSNRGNLKTSTTARGEISFRWRQNFYYSLTGLLVSEGVNDPEEEEIISPPDRLPIMTVHQAKGLEFPFVFVYGLNQNSGPDSSVLLEDALSRFRQNPPFVSFTPGQRAEQDLIRFYYVAYSRAQYALIHLVPGAHFKNGFGFMNRDTGRFLQAVQQI
jgi:DNA helicase-2/ATP-dependent DNA helicase PcrA